MAENPYKPPQDVAKIRPLPVLNFWQRFEVLGYGLLLGFLVAVIASVDSRKESIDNWKWILSGPVAATRLGAAEIAAMGWLGAAMAIAHPIQPSPTSSCVTVVGLALWFFSGLLGLLFLSAK